MLHLSWMSKLPRVFELLSRRKMQDDWLWVKFEMKNLAKKVTHVKSKESHCSGFLCLELSSHPRIERLTALLSSNFFQLSLSRGTQLLLLGVRRMKEDPQASVCDSVSVWAAKIRKILRFRSCAQLLVWWMEWISWDSWVSETTFRNVSSLSLQSLCVSSQRFMKRSLLFLFSHPRFLCYKDL